MSDLVMHRGVVPDYRALASKLRAIDKFEIKAVSGLDPEAGLRQSVESSSRWWVGTIDGVEEMAVGVTPIQNCDGWGAPWMLSSPKVFRGTPLKTFVRRTPEFMELASSGYDVLFNIISDHNHASKRWLRYAGFRLKNETTWMRNFAFKEFIYVVPGGNYDLDAMESAYV